MSNSSDQIIASAIKCVSIHGLSGTRTQMIAKESGLSEAMIFKLFGSKDELLRVCFETVDKEIAALFNGLKFGMAQIKDNPETAVYLLWTQYFKWLISHKEETLFYFAYRTTPFFQEFEKTRKAPWFEDFVAIFYAFDGEYGLYEKISPTILWTQVLTVTQLYAKLVIEGAIPSDEATIQSIFKIQMGSICEMLKK